MTFMYLIMLIGAVVGYVLHRRVVEKMLKDIAYWMNEYGKSEIGVFELQDSYEQDKMDEAEKYDDLAKAYAEKLGELSNLEAEHKNCLPVYASGRREGAQWD